MNFSAELLDVDYDVQAAVHRGGVPSRPTVDMVLRVIRESGLLRDAGHRPEDQRPDEVGQQRERDRDK